MPPFKPVATVLPVFVLVSAIAPHMAHCASAGRLKNRTKAKLTMTLKLLILVIGLHKQIDQDARNGHIQPNGKGVAY